MTEITEAVERVREAYANCRLMSAPLVPQPVIDIELILSELTRLQEEVKGLRGLIDAPELHDFAKGVVLEAAHQRKRWGPSHDAGKDPQDWFWLLGYLGGKALRAALDGDQKKALHHTISTAAACANWHAAITGENAEMRPGIDPADRHLTATLQGQQS